MKLWRWQTRSWLILGEWKPTCFFDSTPFQTETDVFRDGSVAQVLEHWPWGKWRTTLEAIPKLHAFLHCALASSYLSPRLTCCFRQEDNMNVHRTLAQSRGIRGPQVTAKMVAKMGIALHLQLDRMWKRKQSSYARWWFQLFYFHPYLQKIPIFTNIFQMGGSHHLAWVGGWGKQRNAYCDMCAKSTLCQM